MSLFAWATVFFLALIPALCWLVIYNRKDKKDPEPKRVLLKAFILGAALATPFLVLRLFAPLLSTDTLIFAGIKGIIIFAAFEEIAKLSAAVMAVEKHPKVFNQIVDGMVYAITASLGFAFVENLFYFYTFSAFNLNAMEWLSLVGFRSLGTMLAHTLFSGTVGLLWGYAVLSKKITPFHKKGVMDFGWDDLLNPEAWSLHIIRRNILMAHASRRGGHEKKMLVLEGLILATGLHSLFNLLSTFKVGGESVMFLAVPLLMGGFFFASYVFARKKHQHIFRVV